MLTELDPGSDIEVREIKSNPITSEELDELRSLSGSYESLFNRRAMKYRSMGLNEQQLSEDDYRRLILEEYTFLKRPAMVADGKVFLGSSKQAVEGAKEAFNK